MKFTLFSYLILLAVMIFILNKLVGTGSELQEKVLGAYTSQMEEINKETGMNVYNLEKKAYTTEELEELKKIY